jgi:Eukaryotic mitochondrial regulator protein
MAQHGLQSIHLTMSSITFSLVQSGQATMRCPACKRAWRRDFSTTPSKHMTKLRREMFGWLNTRGKNFQEPFQGSTNYLTDYSSSGFRHDHGQEDLGSRGSATSGREGESRQRAESSRQRLPQPFPLNEFFVSRPILSEQLREEIWRRVKVDKKSIRNVSVELGVEMRRVGAVVRLIEVEKQWRAEVSLVNASNRAVFHFM